MEVRNCFYRVSVKALVLNEAKNKFLVVKEPDGRWELPGGGLDWGVTPQEDLPREIEEEMGVPVTWVAARPSYTLVRKSSDHDDLWILNIVYRATLEHLDFTPSDECIDIAFVDKTDVAQMNVFPQVADLAEQFAEDLNAQT